MRELLIRGENPHIIKKTEKIFVIENGFNVIKEELVKRGWVERMKVTTALFELYKAKSNKATPYPRCLEGPAPDFVWIYGERLRFGSSGYLSGLPSQKGAHLPMINVIQSGRKCVTNKNGLNLIQREEGWYTINNVAEILTPRTYDANDEDDLEEFKNDYRITACTSLLKYVLMNKSFVHSINGRISLDMLVFAIERCTDFIYCKRNDDIVQEVQEIIVEWSPFLNSYYLILEENASFKLEHTNRFELCCKYAPIVLEQMQKCRPQVFCEGMGNVWIMKPDNLSRGKGITMDNKIHYIIQNTKRFLGSKKAKYNLSVNTVVIQKYIEEPFLVYGHKFDIRQHILISNTYPLVIWMYKKCYLRFGSRMFTLDDFHEAIHLTNHAVQQKYPNHSSERDPRIPSCNMWTSERFRKHLTATGYSDVWDNIIIPGFKKNALGAMLGCQDDIVHTKNRFGLYGCDFILDRNFTPWLLEVNSRPNLTGSTHVSEEICTAVMRDMIKVLIDSNSYSGRHKAAGDFVCIYYQDITPMIKHNLIDRPRLFIDGTQIMKIGEGTFDNNIIVEHQFDAFCGETNDIHIREEDIVHLAFMDKECQKASCIALLDDESDVDNIKFRKLL